MTAQTLAIAYTQCCAVQMIYSNASSPTRPSAIMSCRITSHDAVSNVAAASSVRRGLALVCGDDLGMTWG